jgi:glycosyltransferase involved in cell wall biosynthesis
MTETYDIAAILTGHREGLLAGPSVASALEAFRVAERHELSCQLIVVLDRADRLTRSTLRNAVGPRAIFIESDEGDPGQARNRGIEAVSARFATFLDADDLWSENWLVAAHRQGVARPDAVYHCACIYRFGDHRRLFWHIDSESLLYDQHYLVWGNYWDAMSFAATEIYRRFPFRHNDLKLGFGHEDWHWSAWTFAEGVQHKPVPRTIHFKRGRPGSQMSLVEKAGGIRWPLKILHDNGDAF